MAMEDDGPEPSDPELLAAVRELTAAVKAIKTPVIPPFDVKPIVAAIADMPGAGEKIDALSADIRALTAAVEKIEIPDMAGIIGAIVTLHTTQQAMIRAMMAPKELTYDQDGNPTGIKPVRMN